MRLSRIILLFCHSAALRAGLRREEKLFPSVPTSELAGYYQPSRWRNCLPAESRKPKMCHSEAELCGEAEESAALIWR
jgi:hypothetical protein